MLEKLIKESKQGGKEKSQDEGDTNIKKVPIENPLATVQIILNTEKDRQKIKLLIENLLNENKEKGLKFDNYLVTENDENSNEIAILKKGDIQQLGLFICRFCPMLFGSEIEMDIHERVHYFGFG